MESNFPHYDQIVYVDVEFVSQKYERITGVSAQSVMTRTEGGQAGVKAYFVSAGVHTQESRTYPMSSSMMLQRVFERLKEDYDPIDLDAWENGKGSRTGWIRGNMTLGRWIRKVNGEEKENHKYYELHSGGKRVGLLPKIEYFSPGFSDLLDVSAALMSNIDTPVEMLGRMLYYAQVSSTYVCAPLLILETGTTGT
jgi:hypothetical protein